MDKNGIHFGFFGDWGTGEEGQKKVAKRLRKSVHNGEIQFVCGLGDNFYPDGVSPDNYERNVKNKFTNIYHDIPTHFYMVLGNHDYYGNPKLQLSIASLDHRWVMPNYYYDFVLQSRSGVKAHFVVVDSNHKEYRDTDWNQQCKWLRHTLQRTKNRVHWTIILCHHPWKSTGWHGNSSGNLKKMFDNVVKSYPIDFILAGHDHDMQVINVGNKTTQIVVGTGAVVREHQPRNPSPNKMLFCEETLGFGKLSLFKTVAHLRMISPDNTEPIFNTRFLPKSTLYTQKRNLSNRKKSLQ